MDESVTFRYPHAEEAMTRLEEAVERHRPDTLLGFSQGAILITLLTAAHETYFASLPEDSKRAVDATRSPEEVAEEVYAAIIDLERSINPSSPQTVMAEPHKMAF